MIREPFYELEIKTGNCWIEILVNNLPVFSNYEDGGMAVDYPINDAIIENGTQSLEIRLLASDGTESISRYADYEVKVFVKEANAEGSGRKLVYEVPQNTDYKEKPLFISTQKASFRAEIPYKNIGWTDSVDLLDFPKDMLLQELKEKLHKITAIYNSKNITDYRKLYNNRVEEHNKSFYLTDEEIRENAESTFSGLPEKLESIDWQTYQLVFYGEGKLVSLQTRKQPPGFVFESLNKDEYGFTEMLLFHKKTNDSPLEIIR